MNSDLEKKLIAACRKGDASAYVGLVRAYSGRIFAICLGMLGNRDDAEDAAQQVFLKGFTGINRLRDNGQFGAWIARIARNFCTDFIRRKSRKPDAAAQPPRSDPSEQDRYIELKVALAKLPVEYRIVLMLYYFDGKSTKNIAETFEVSQAAVHARLSRARKRLRTLLEMQGDIL